jgi:hypothetical protein
MAANSIVFATAEQIIGKRFTATLPVSAAGAYG